MNLDANAIFGQFRPTLSLVGSLLIIAGLLKFAGINVPINGSGLELAFAGLLCKHI